MRDFPSIDKQAEAVAAQTLFFIDGEIERRPCQMSRANYLAFLSMGGAEVANEISKLRALFSDHSGYGHVAGPNLVSVSLRWMRDSSPIAPRCTFRPTRWPP